MLGMACNFRPDWHCIIDHEVIRWIKRECSDPQLRGRLFMYFQTQFRNYVIGLWTGDSKKSFVDVMNLGLMPKLSNANALSLRQNLFKPTSGREVARSAAAAESDRLHQLQDEGGEINERMMRGYNGRISA